jgi:hypothetical protein
MGAKVTITWDGLEQMIGDLSAMEEKAPQNIEAQTKKLADATETAWRQATPKGKTGRLQEGDKAQPGGMSFTLNNATTYYPFVDDDHKTPAEWHTKKGLRIAKRRTLVKGKQMTEKAVQFVEENIEDYLSKFLDNV